MNLFEISSRFPDEVSAADHFERVRWGATKSCPYCKGQDLTKRYADLRYNCKTCKRRFSVTTGTQIHNTRMPLQKWLFAFALVTDAKKGISAKQLERNIGVTYKVAWAMYHKIREMMSIEAKTMAQLDGVVEMDETFIGGKPRKPNAPGDIPQKTVNYLDGKLKELKDAGVSLKRGKGNPAKVDYDTKRGRGSQKKIPVVGIVERDGSVVAEVMQSLTAANLKKMVEKHVDSEGAIIITDSYKGYGTLHKIIEHVKIDHKIAYSYRGINTNTIESFWAIVERGIMGQYHRVSRKHLPKYVVEFVFKFNNRKQDDMFETLVKHSMLALIPHGVVAAEAAKPKKQKPKTDLPF